MIQQKIYFSEASYKKMIEDGYLGTANIIFEKTLHKEEIFNIGKQSHFYIVDEDLKQRIDKAIEYIEKDMKRILIPFDEFVIWDDTNVENEINKLLDILKGKDE